MNRAQKRSKCHHPLLPTLNPYYSKDCPQTKKERTNTNTSSIRNLKFFKKRKEI